MSLSIITIGPHGGLHHTNQCVDDDVIGAEDAHLQFGSAMQEALELPLFSSALNGSAKDLAEETLDHMQQEAEILVILVDAEQDDEEDTELLEEQETNWGEGMLIAPHSMKH